MESRLDEERARIRKIAEPVLERFTKMRGQELETEIMSQNIKIQGADAAHQNAKLSREISEIAVKEYEEGIYLQNLAAAEGEVRLAEADIKGSSNSIEEATTQLEKIKKLSSGNMFDTLAVDQFEARLKVVQLAKRKAELALEMTKSKLNVLRDYEKPKRLSELKAEVEKARSNELVKEQTYQLERTKLARLKKQAEGIKPPANLQNILSLLAEAVKLDHEIRVRVAALEPKEGLSRAGWRTEVEELGRSLETKVNEAGRLFENLKFSELASDINFAASRPNSGTSLLSPANARKTLEKLGKISPEDRAKLKNATDDERERIYKKAGFTNAEIQELKYRRERIQRGETGP